MFVCAICQRPQEARREVLVFRVREGEVGALLQRDPTNRRCIRTTSAGVEKRGRVSRTFDISPEFTKSSDPVRRLHFRPCRPSHIIVGDARRPDDAMFDRRICEPRDSLFFGRSGMGSCLKHLTFSRRAGGSDGLRAAYLHSGYSQ